MTQDEWPLFPVSGWEIGTIPAYDAIFIRLEFLSHAMQAPGQADPGRRYLFAPALARELARKIIEQADRMESGGLQSPPGERH